MVPATGKLIRVMQIKQLILGTVNTVISNESRLNGKYCPVMKVKYFFWQIRRWIVMNSMRLIYATVNSKGKVTMKKAGIGKIVTITATAKDGSTKKGTYRIKIMEQLQY